MKKIIFFILSTVFVLIIPNVVNAQTVSLTVANRNLDFGTSNYVQVSLNASHGTGFDFGDGFLVFSMSATSPDSMPYTASIEMNDGYGYTCSLSSVNSGVSSSSSVSNTVTISAICPISYTSNRYPTSLLIERAVQTSYLGNYLILPYRLTYYTGADMTAIVNSTNNTTNAINDVNDSINNDSVSSNAEHSSTASSWASNNASDSVVSDMVLMPITLLNAFSSGFNSSCQSYNLGSLYGTNLTLPCINIENYLGATLWGIIDVLMSGFLIYGIGKKFVRVFNDFTNLKDSQVDELYGGGNE